MATATDDIKGVEQQPVEEEVSTPVEESSPAIFKYAVYVDAPDECGADQAKRGSCKDPEHFHAWCRLPNKFQHKEIREKALAARARRQRQLRDLDSDSRVVLEDDMHILANLPKEEIVEEIISFGAGGDLAEAMKDVLEIEAEDQPEDGETVYLYTHIEEDEERLRKLEAEDVREGEEYEELVRHVNGYYKAIEGAQKERQQPERDGLLARESDDLVDLVRQHRIETEGTEEFLHTYNSYLVVYGALHSDKSGRQFNDLEALKNQAPEVVDHLLVAFSRLESGAREGNS